MKPTLKLAIVGVFVVAALAIVFLAKGGKGSDPATGSAAVQPKTDKPAMSITVSVGSTTNCPLDTDLAATSIAVVRTIGSAQS